MKPKGVAEGQPVNIPALPAGAMGGRSRLGGPEPWTSPARSAGWEVGKSASQKLCVVGKPVRVTTPEAREPRKASKHNLREPVPQTDTGGRVQEHSGARENPRQGTLQVGPVTSGEGVLPGVMSSGEPQ